MHSIFIDESGDHNLNLEKVDRSYPLFILCACVFKTDHYENIFSPKFEELKRRHFGTSGIILHTADLCRPLRSQDNRYHIFKNKELRVNCYKDLNKLIAETDFKVIACVIDKLKHVDVYGVDAIDPYVLSLENILNRVVYEAKPHTADIYAEKRGEPLDTQIELVWLRTKVSGTQKWRGATVSKTIREFRLVPKSANMPGLQLTDLIVSPIGRKILKLAPRLEQEVDFDIISSKFRRSQGGVLKSYGLTFLPHKKRGPH